MALTEPLECQGDVRRALVPRRGDQLGEPGDAGQDQQAVEPAVVCALDVGVEPVTHDQGRVPPTRRRVSSKRRGQRLAGDHRLAPGEARDRFDEDAVAGAGSVRGGHGQVGVQATQGRPSRTRIAPSVTCRPAEVGVVARHHCHRLVVGGLDRTEALLLERLVEAGPPDDEDRGPGGQLLGEQARRGLGGGDDVVVEAGMPRSLRCLATRPGGREALLVT